MPKTVKTIIKLNLPAGEATPAPPVGPALGQHGLPIMEFIRSYNEKTAKLKGNIIPAVITVFTDRTFTFITKLPPVAMLLKKALNLPKGAGKTGHEQVASISADQIQKIAQEKLADLNTSDLKSAVKIVQGTAKSMGIKIS